MKTRRVAAAMFALALLGAACGSESKGDGGDALGSSTSSSVPITVPSLSPGNLPGTATPPGSGGPVGGAPGSTGTGSAPGSGTKGGSDGQPPPLPVAVELANACVRPGGSQTVTVRTTPESTVGYDTTWSDGKNGMTGGYGGTGNGHAPTGTWTHSFTVGPQAPKGNATVTGIGVNMSGSTGQAKADFTVADLTGNCA